MHTISNKLNVALFYHYLVASQEKYHYILRFGTLAKIQTFFSGENRGCALLTRTMRFRGVISQNIIRRKPYITLYKGKCIGRNGTERQTVLSRAPARRACGSRGGAFPPYGRQLFCGVCKKLGKKMSKSVDKGGGVWYYT